MPVIIANKMYTLDWLLLGHYSLVMLTDKLLACKNKKPHNKQLINLEHLVKPHPCCVDGARAT